MALIALLVSVMSASAACPATYTYCDGGAGGGVPICTQDVSGNITCSLAANGVSVDPNISAFSPGGAGNFRAYGTDADNNKFCCEYTYSTSSCQVAVTVNGTTRVDDIAFNDAGVNLLCTSAFVYGDAGNDIINGSHTTNNVDHLYGESGNDSINGWDGDDYIEGGDNADTCNGGDGADDIYGGAGTDTIDAGLGDDYVDGGSEVDAIKGGAGADTLLGGSAGDDICGEQGNDLLSGETEDDYLVGGPGTDSAYGGSSGVNDYCDAETTDASCDYVAGACPF